MADHHREALLRTVADHIIDEARRRYVKSRDSQAIRRYLRKQGLQELTIDETVDRIVGEVG